jgi:hypothetical protein
MAATSGVHALHCHRKHGAILRGKQREPQCCKLRLLPRAFAWVGRAISEIGIRGLAEPHEVRVLSQLPERQSRKHTQEYPSQDTATCRTNQTEQQTLEWNTPHTYCSRRHHRQREQLAVSGPQEVGVIWKGKSEQALVQQDQGLFAKKHVRAALALTAGGGAPRASRAARVVHVAPATDEWCQLAC